MADVTLMQMKPVKIQTMLYELVDTLWLFSSLIHQSPPNWQGFVAKIVKGVWDCTAIGFHPMIPLNPSSDDVVYIFHNIMFFVLQQAGKLSMCCAALTFVHPLYLSTYRTKEENQHEFQNLTFRVGGFHQLMSFLGAGSKLMEGSGLKYRWQLFMPGNHSPNMMEG